MIYTSLVACLFLSAALGHQARPMATVVDNDPTTQIFQRYDDIFTKEEYKNMRRKRIRREIRDMSMNEFNAVVDAMWVMKTTSNTDGKALYGPNFVNYDELVCRHAEAAYASDGDKAHFFTHFNLWHRMYVLEFEASLRAINPDIESFPYWNVARDSGNEFTTEIFGDSYFGAFRPSIVNEDESPILKNGKFANWPIYPADNIETLNPYNNNEKYCTGLMNGYGLLRGRGNQDGRPWIVRYGGNFCGIPLPLNDYPVIQSCIFDTGCDAGTSKCDTFTKFEGCIEDPLHGQVHGSIGSTTELYPGQQAVWDSVVDDDFIEEYGFLWCMDWPFKAPRLVTEDNCYIQVNTFAPGPITGCFECPEPGDCVEGVDTNYDCFCHTVSPDGKCYANIPGESTPREINLLPREYHAAWGDFTDDSTSPNDPIFMFHHSNMDRIWEHWMLENWDLRNTLWNYPTTTTYINGVNLDDLVQPNYPFGKHLLDGTEYDPSKGYVTIRDVVEHFFFADYEYDTIIDSIKPIDDSSSSSSSSSSSGWHHSSSSSSSSSSGSGAHASQHGWP